MRTPLWQARCLLIMLVVGCVAPQGRSGASAPPTAGAVSTPTARPTPTRSPDVPTAGPTPAASPSPPAAAPGPGPARSPVAGPGADGFDPARIRLELERAWDGFSKPLGLTHAGDGSGRVFVLEQRGLIKVIDQGRVRPQPLLDLTGQVSAIGASYSERGLLGLAFHPASTTTGWSSSTTPIDAATRRWRAIVCPRRNPFRARQGARAEVWAYGLRNPWRYSFDRATGDLYIADVGQSAWEEIDVQPAGSGGGQNYGWNLMEDAHRRPGAACDPSGLTLPVAEYGRSMGCSVTGGYVYRGTAQPGLIGAYVYGDYCRRTDPGAGARGGREPVLAASCCSAVIVPPTLRMPWVSPGSHAHPPS